MLKVIKFNILQSAFKKINNNIILYVFKLFRHLLEYFLYHQITKH